MNYKQKLMIFLTVSLLLGVIAKVLYFDKKHINFKANKINFVEISLRNSTGAFDTKKYVCDDFRKVSFINAINKFEKDTLTVYHFLIGNILFNFNSTESINAQIFSLGDKIYLKFGEVVFSGRIDLNSYFKELDLIFFRYSANDIKTIQLKIEKSEVSPYFMGGGIFEPQEGTFDQIIGHLKKSKSHPSWSLMYYGEFIIEKKSGQKYEDTLLFYENNLFFVVRGQYYYVDNKILELFEEKRM